MALNVAVDEENEEFLESYKKLGYPTKTALVNDALARLRRQRAKEFRAALRHEMLESYAATKLDFVWESLDGEDFKD